jgi:ABC-2 type transport system permease protein
VTWVAEGIGIGALSAPGLLAAGTLTRAGLVHIACSALWSALLFAAVGLATAACAFWIVRIEELQVFTLNATGTACLYPLEIYPRWLRATLLYVLPIAMGNYVPVVYVLGKGGTALNLVLPPIASAVSLFLAYRFWQLGEARYHSTGS